VYPHGQNGKEFGYLVDIGMTPAQALLSSSLGSARLLGIDGETGTLANGLAADVVAVRGDVLANIRATEAPILVMKGGKIVLGRSETAVTAP
jgi:imidazolonepropionase-like amidohydrolase